MLPHYENVAAETILKDKFGREEGTPACDHVLTVAIVFYMSDYAFWEHLGYLWWLCGLETEVQGDYL